MAQSISGLQQYQLQPLPQTQTNQTNIIPSPSSIVK
jgi:hypothetical protein